jgi:hypothetical protein
MGMILNIRGTHGSGKSCIVHKILKQFGAKELPEGNKIGAYRVQCGLRKSLYIIGPYKTACGGCDAIQPYDLIWPRVERYATLGHVLFEGALVSSSVGNIGRAMAARKDCVVAFMDTPVEECLARIQRRRIAKGDDRPLNPKNTVSKFEGILRSRPQLESLGLRCVTLHYRRAYQEVLALLGVK